MDDLTKGFLTHWQKTHPGGTIKYFDANEPLHISQFNSVDDPTFPPKTLYKDFPSQESEQLMSTNERDTHFEHAAKLLFEKTMATRAMDTVDADRFLDDGDKAELQTLFAQFAYDLAYYVVSETMGGTPNAITIILASYVSDLTSWPDTSPQ